MQCHCKVVRFTLAENVQACIPEYEDEKAR